MQKSVILCFIVKIVYDENYKYESLKGTNLFPEKAATKIYGRKTRAYAACEGFYTRKEDLIF